MNYTGTQSFILIGLKSFGTTEKGISFGMFINLLSIVLSLEIPAADRHTDRYNNRAHGRETEEKERERREKKEEKEGGGVREEDRIIKKKMLVLKLFNQNLKV